MTVEKDWSAVVFVDGPDGVIAVRKRLKSAHWGFWHLPGGKKDPGDRNVEETALRELWEETGIDANGMPFAILHRERRSVIKRRGNGGRPYEHFYDLYFCVVTLTDVARDPLRPTTPHEGAALLSRERFREMEDFMLSHRRFLEGHGLVPDTHTD